MRQATETLNTINHLLSPERWLTGKYFEEFTDGK